ncbi:MAG: RnfABCDGE type electron transport complex subunit G [Bacillota bacterium]
MEKESIGRLVLTLTVIGIISALTLAFVYQWTTPYIKEHQAAAQEKAVFNVLPGAEKFEEVNKNGHTFYEGYNNAGSRVGIAYIAVGGGFQGQIELMIGVNLNEEKIYGISILTHSETPGLGARITEDAYKSNFVDKPFGDYTVIKRETTEPTEVEAISGATISSEKVTTIIENAVSTIQSAYGGGM